MDTSRVHSGTPPSTAPHTGISSPQDSAAERRLRRLTALMDAAPDALLEMDHAGTITWWSAGAGRLLGWTADEALGRRMAELLVPAQHRPVHEAALAALRAGRPQAGLDGLLGAAALHRGGGTVAVSCSVFEVPADGDPRIGMQLRPAHPVPVAANAGTPAPALPDEVLRTAERYRAVIEHVNEGMIVIKDERVAYANARAAEIAGISMQEIQQIGFLHRVHPDDHGLVLDRQRRRLAGEPVPSRYELRLLLPDGEVRWIGISATVVPWDGEQAALVFFSDISQRKHLEETLRSTLQERETVLENSLVGISFLTDKGTFRWSNSAMGRIFGAAPGQKAPTDWNRLFPSPQDYQRVLAEVLACMREGRAYQGDLQMRKLDGSLFWVRASGKPVSVADRTQGTVWAVMDITPHKELEAALARASSEREAIFNSALVGISYNVNRRIQWVNDKYEEMTGYSRRELVGQSTRLFYDDDILFEMHGHETREALMRDGVYVDERRMLRRDRTEFWVQLAGRCISGRDPAAGVIWTLLDITERRRAEANTLAALAREKELNDLRSRFVSMTSHEFRTPLTTILSAAELLKDYSERMAPEQRAEVLDSIGAGVQRMTRMLDRVLLLGKAEAHMLEFTPRQLDLRVVCRDLVEQARLLPESAACRLVLDCDGLPQGTGPYDEKLLRHIFDNLLSNAVKYSPEGGEVRLKVFEDADRQTVFEVSDQGIGIPEHEIGHLFESFHRASNVGSIAGTGLGLAIVKQSVELHRGSIAVRSTEGQGTCFSVRLG